VSDGREERLAVHEGRRDVEKEARPASHSGQDVPTAPRPAHCRARFAYEKFHKVEVIDIVVGHERGRSIELSR